MEEVFYQQVTRIIHAASREHASEHALNNEAMSLRSGELALRMEVKEISPQCSLEGLMLKLILQYFGLADVKN